jgi:hypothetical protein
MKPSEVSTNPPVLPNIYRYQGWWRVRWSGKDEPDVQAARFVYRLNFFNEDEWKEVRND